MNDCQSCAHWITARVTVYDDGSRIETFHSSIQKGRCDVLDIETAPDFGCNSYQHGAESIRYSWKTGAPWQHWTMDRCPDCQAKGNANDGACHRCAGTGQVRHYEDGYVGEERTRLHPKEREAAGKPKCAGCQHEVEAEWVACPRCGHKLDAPVDVEKVADALFVG